ncbi:MAG TPA: hypothetical protein DDW50_10505 [Firmicutes bacterium]|jgi:antitoxin YqcF|nr:hypothetical protein [Bacillota bacterium]
MSVSNGNKVIAKATLDAFGGKPIVTKYWDDKKESSIDMLSCVDRPYQGITAYSTIGLSEYSIGFISEEIPLRIEIVGACASRFDYFANVLSSCAFNVINTKFTCNPGTIFPKVIGLYKPSSLMQHIFFMSPFLWDDKLKTLQLTERKVAWLLAVPISDKEFTYAKENETDALQNLFEEHQIDIFDLDRRSVI